MESTLSHCKSCKAELHGAFCSQCGQKVILERYTLKKIFSELIANLFNLEKGFFFTLKKLFIAPEEVIGGYLDGQTKKYYNPIRFFLIWISLQVLVMVSFDIWENQFEQVETIYERIGLIKTDADRDRMKTVVKTMQNFLSIIPLFLIPFYSFMSYQLFRKKGLYFAEHCILTVYVIGMSAVVGLLSAIAYAIFPSLVQYAFAVSILTFGFFFFLVFKRFFQSDLLEAILYAFMTVIGGYILFFISCFLIGMLVGLMIFIVLFLYRKIIGG